MGVAGAVMTAFYMTRLFIGIFYGDFKGWKIVKKWKEPRTRTATTTTTTTSTSRSRARRRTSRRWQMTVPLVILGAFCARRGLPERAPLPHARRSTTGSRRCSRRRARSSRSRHPRPDDAVHRRGRRGVRRGRRRRVLGLRDEEGRARARASSSAFPGSTRSCATSGASTSSTKRRSSARSTRSPRSPPWVDKWIVDGIIARLTRVRRGRARHAARAISRRARAGLRARHGRRARRLRLVLPRCRTPRPASIRTTATGATASRRRPASATPTAGTRTATASGTSDKFGEQERALVRAQARRDAQGAASR